MTGMIREEELTVRARRVIADNLGVDESAVTPESRFVEDLGADSLDLVELMMAMEEEFGGEAEEEEAEKAHNFQDAVNLIKKKKGIKE